MQAGLPPLLCVCVCVCVFAACFCLHLCVTSARVPCVLACVQRATDYRTLVFLLFRGSPEAPRRAPLSTRQMEPQAGQMDPFAAAVWPASWHRPAPAYADAPWRQAPFQQPDHPQQQFARGGAGPTSWMQRAAERLDLEHKSGTVLSTRPSPSWSVACAP